MSSRKDSRKKKQRDNTTSTGGRLHWEYIQTYRRNLMRTMNDVRAGKVRAIDLDKLQNWIQMSLLLAERVKVEVMHEAWRDIEIMSWVHDDLADHQVILHDNLLQAPVQQVEVKQDQQHSN